MSDRRITEAQRPAGKYASFAELMRHEAEGRDYRVLRRERAGARLAVIAPHGGEIEVGTSEIATLIAGREHSLFCFEGLVNARNKDLHITSHRFDHPECLSLASRHDLIVGVHGCKGRARIFLGGLDAELKQLLALELANAGFDAGLDGHPYPGRHPQNICNRGRRGAGVQLEITYDLRMPSHHGAIARAVRAGLGRRG